MNIRKMTTLAFVLAIVSIVVGLCSCDRVASVLPDAKMPTDEMPEMMTAPEIPIGVVLSLTGKDAEPYGIAMQRGFELAKEEINMLGSVNLTFITADDQSNVAGATAAVQQLVHQGVPAIVGIAISTYLKAAFPIAQEAGVVAFSSVSSAAGLSALGDFIFRAGLATDRLIPGGVMATQEKLGYQKVAALYDALDVYATSSHEEIKKALETSDVDLLIEETFQTGDTDFSEQLTHIRDAAPDALFVSALTPEMIQILIQARKIGLPTSVRLIVSDLTMDDIEKIGEAAEGAVVFTGWTRAANTPGNQTFIQKYRTKYGSEPSWAAAQSYATLSILANAIVNAPSTDPTAIREALAQTVDFPTILGNFSFDPNGEAVYDPVILVVNNGELQVFE